LWLLFQLQVFEIPMDPRSRVSLVFLDVVEACRKTAAVDASMCHVLPESVSLELAALIEPPPVAHHAALCAAVKDWRTLSVLGVGGGPIVVALVIILRTRGVRKIFVSEPTLKGSDTPLKLPTPLSIRRMRMLENGGGR
jgi:hypothetical protein